MGKFGAASDLGVMESRVAEREMVGFGLGRACSICDWRSKTVDIVRVW